MTNAEYPTAFRALFVMIVSTPAERVDGTVRSECEIRRAVDHAVFPTLHERF